MVSQEKEVRIMVVEDDRHWVEWIKDIVGLLSSEGLAWSIVAYATTIEQAQAHIVNHTQTQFTHVLLDGNLGKSRFDGYQVAQSLVQQLPDVRIIGMSGSAQGELNAADRRSSLSQQNYVDKYLGKDSLTKESLTVSILSTITTPGDAPDQN